MLDFRKLPKGTKVYGHKESKWAKKFGITTGGVRRCTMEGCSGLRIRVKWPDGLITWPCSKGLSEGPRKDTLRIA